MGPAGDDAVTEVVDDIPAKVIQIQAVPHPGGHNCGPHALLYALCSDGSVWVQYHSDGSANVPTDGFWYSLNTPFEGVPSHD